jgi:DNA-binding CsgD family transcriptional regulator
MIAEIAQENVVFTLGQPRETTQVLPELFYKLVTELHNRYQQEIDLADPAVQKQPILQLEIEGYQYALVCVGVHKATQATNTVLSPRELEIARLISKGHPNKAIALILEISPWTVATHLRRIYTKLEVKSRAEMVAKLMKAGTIGNQRARF